MLFYLVLFAVIGYFYYHLHHKRRNLPPGPMPLPVLAHHLLGNLLDVIREPPGEGPYRRWKEQYGAVSTYWMGATPIVSIGDYQTIMDTFQKDGETYAGRYAFKEFDVLVRGGDYGVIFTEGDMWREQRRFALQVLRDFGLGKNLMQERVLDEVSAFLQQIDEDAAAGVKEHPLPEHVDLAIGSIINALLFGYGFRGEKRAEFFDLKQRVALHVKMLGHPLTMVAMPNPRLFLKLPFIGRYVQSAVDTGNYLLKFYRDRIHDHEQTLDENEPPSDFVHAFLQEWRKRDRAGEVHFFSHDQLVSMLYDMWLAGQETTSNTLAWGFAYLIHCPEIQKKCHEELDAVVGSDRLVTMSDKPNLPYCNAVINEVQRIANLVPQNVWHKTTKDTTINGHFIRKGTAILPQISIILSDPKVYEGPLRFDPNRFLDANGKLKKADELIPFSVGKRACLGEGLARMELFLFTVNTLNRYTLSAGKKLPNLQRKFGGTVNIDPFHCRMERRVHS
ncbi:Cytochrome P450 33C9 [Aphelenchoides fujianensis]|nr:Cytochrome P450 33C9 [Aphelenchoides fujianensis]